ncbi:hypothetical protein GCM10027072_60740 [Streptomyces bullii]
MGLRRGEIVGLRWSDLDLDNRVLHVRQQTQRRRGVLYGDDPKGRRRRAVPLPALCIAPLRWHRMLQAAARAKAGIIRLHDARHGHASHGGRGRAPSGGTHVVQDTQREAMSHMDRLLRRRPTLATAVVPRRSLLDRACRGHMLFSRPAQVAGDSPCLIEPSRRLHGRLGAPSNA